MGKAKPLMAPVHPGEIPREDFMKPLGLSVNKLALGCTSCGRLSTTILLTFGSEGATDTKLLLL
jgi:hypothetical protein